MAEADRPSAAGEQTSAELGCCPSLSRRTPQARSGGHGVGTSTNWAVVNVGVALHHVLVTERRHCLSLSVGILVLLFLMLKSLIATDVSMSGVRGRGR